MTTYGASPTPLAPLRPKPRASRRANTTKIYRSLVRYEPEPHRGEAAAYSASPGTVRPDTVHDPSVILQTAYSGTVRSPL